MRNKSPAMDLARELKIDKKVIYGLITELFPEIEKDSSTQYVLTNEHKDLLRGYLVKPEGITINQIANELFIEPARIRYWVKKVLPEIKRTRYGFYLTVEQAQIVKNVIGGRKREEY
jgi:hypothetical protein